MLRFIRSDEPLALSLVRYLTLLFLVVGLCTLVGWHVHHLDELGTVYVDSMEVQTLEMPKLLIRFISPKNDGMRVLLGSSFPEPYDLDSEARGLGISIIGKWKHYFLDSSRDFSGWTYSDYTLRDPTRKWDMALRNVILPSEHTFNPRIGVPASETPEFVHPYLEIIMNAGGGVDPRGRMNLTKLDMEVFFLDNRTLAQLYQERHQPLDLGKLGNSKRLSLRWGRNAEIGFTRQDYIQEDNIRRSRYEAQFRQSRLGSNGNMTIRVFPMNDPSPDALGFLVPVWRPLRLLNAIDTFALFLGIAATVSMLYSLWLGPGLKNPRGWLSWRRQHQLAASGPPRMDGPDQHDGCAVGDALLSADKLPPLSSPCTRIDAQSETNLWPRRTPSSSGQRYSGLGICTAFSDNWEDAPSAHTGYFGCRGIWPTLMDESHTIAEPASSTDQATDAAPARIHPDTASCPVDATSLSMYSELFEMAVTLQWCEEMRAVLVRHFISGQDIAESEHGQRSANSQQCDL